MGIPIEITFDGDAYAGSFDLDAKSTRIMLTVSTVGYGNRTTELRGTPPHILAKMILRDLVERHLRGKSVVRLVDAV